MNVLLTFDVEVWCDSWETLDQDFERCFDRYVFGRSRHGSYALPKTLDTLARHGLKAVFFVEPLFAARFGIEHLATIVGLVRSAGQEVQLHLHPEWTDESHTQLLPEVGEKRQHLSYYSLEDQERLIGHGLRLLQEAGADKINAFRAGSFACNANTFTAVEASGLSFDSSLDITSTISGADLDTRLRRAAPFSFGRVGVYPLGVFVDGFGVQRHAQVGACSYRELEKAITDAARLGWETFVLLSHNFELLRHGRAEPDWVVVNRFEELARFMAQCRSTYPTTGFFEVSMPPFDAPQDLPRSDKRSTTRRYCEQIARRIAG